MSPVADPERFSQLTAYQQTAALKAASTRPSPHRRRRRHDGETRRALLCRRTRRADSLRLPDRGAVSRQARRRALQPDARSGTFPQSPLARLRRRHQYVSLRRAHQRCLRAAYGERPQGRHGDDGARLDHAGAPDVGRLRARHGCDHAHARRRHRAITGAKDLARAKTRRGCRTRIFCITSPNTIHGGILCVDWQKVLKIAQQNASGRRRRALSFIPGSSLIDSSRLLLVL